MSIPTNPYTTGDPVGETSGFIGRQDVLRAVLQMLSQPHPNAITLFGQRRIGKTSVLQYLAKHLSNSGPYHPVFFDLQDRANSPLEIVLFDLARKIANSLDLKDPRHEDFSKEIFREIWLPDVLKNIPQGHSVVLLFDEFDSIADPKAGQAVEEFFPYLRTLLALNPLRLQFVFVLGRNISDLANIAFSVFRGVPDKRVSLMSEMDTAKLIRLSEVNNSLNWTNDAIERVWQLTSGHPYLTQKLCSQVWEAAYDAEELDAPPQVVSEMVDAASPQTLESVRNVLEWLWNGLPPAEKVVIAALAQAGPRAITETDLNRILQEAGVRILIRELEKAPQTLEDWDILEPTDGGFRFRVELLRRWIETNYPLKRVQVYLDYTQPAAESLYQAAEVFYQQGDLKKASTLLSQAVELNPNHVRASISLAEIFIATGQLKDSQELLEKLHGVAPIQSKPRLIQTYLKLAQNSSSIAEQLEFVNKVLTLEPQHPTAIQEHQTILAKFRQRQLDETVKVIHDLSANKDFEQAYQKANSASSNFPEHDWNPVLALLQKRELENIIKDLEDLEKKDQTEDAYQQVKSATSRYPDYDWAPMINRLRKKEASKTLKKIEDLEQQQCLNMVDEYLQQGIQEFPEEYDWVALKNRIKQKEEKLRATFQANRPSALLPKSYILLLILLLKKPFQLEIYQKLYTTDKINSVIRRLAFFLIWIPVFIVVLGIGFDTFPISAKAMNAAAYLTIALGLAFLGLFYISFVDILAKQNTTNQFIIYFLLVFILSGTVIGYIIGGINGAAWGAVLGLGSTFLTGLLGLSQLGILLLFCCGTIVLVSTGAIVGIAIGNTFSFILTLIMSVSSGVAFALTKNRLVDQDKTTNGFPEVIVILLLAGIMVGGEINLTTSPLWVITIAVISIGGVSFTTLYMEDLVIKNIQNNKPTTWLLVALVLAWSFIMIYTFGGNALGNVLSIYIPISTPIP